MNSSTQTIQENFKAYLDSVETNVTANLVKEVILEKPESFARQYEQFLLNTVEYSILEKDDKNMFKREFMNSHERICLHSMKGITDLMIKNNIQLTMQNGEIVFKSIENPDSEDEQYRVLNFFGELFSKY